MMEMTLPVGGGTYGWLSQLQWCHEWVSTVVLPPRNDFHNYGAATYD
jgi:phage major head subunit gpT-like protein